MSNSEVTDRVIWRVRNGNIISEGRLEDLRSNGTVVPPGGDPKDFDPKRLLIYYVKCKALKEISQLSYTGITGRTGYTCLCCICKFT